MRFAIKTSPQHTNFADMLAVWQAADDIDLFESGLDLRPLLSDLLRPHRAVPRRMGHHDGARAGDQAAPRRRARHRQRVPASGRAREHGREPRRHLERPARVRHRRGLEPAGMRRVRHRPSAACASASTGSTRPSRSSSNCSRRPRRTSRASTTNSTTRTASRSRCNEPHPPIVIGGGGEKRTLRTVARWAQHWNVPGGGVDVYKHKRDVLRAHCEEIGRDVSEITTSTHLRLDPEQPRRARAPRRRRSQRPGSISGSCTSRRRTHRPCSSR